MGKANTKSVEPVKTEQVSDGALNTLVGYNIKRISNIFQGDLAQTLKPLDLRMITFTTLVLIEDNPGVRQSQLAASLSIERPNSVVIIDELEHRGLITRAQDPSDRRAYGLYTTAAGQQLQKKALRAVHAHEKALLSNINDKQRKQIDAALKLLITLRQSDQARNQSS